MFKVEFENSNGKKREIGFGKTIEEANQIVMMFLADHNFKCHYIRSWGVAPKVQKLDVGSHSEFFYISES